MTEKEQKYRAYFRNIGKHLHKNEYIPINLATHPMKLRCVVNRINKDVLVDWGWAARTKIGSIIIPIDDKGNPHPYEGFWEARCLGCVI